MCALKHRPGQMVCTNCEVVAGGSVVCCVCLFSETVELMLDSIVTLNDTASVSQFRH